VIIPAGPPPTITTSYFMIDSFHVMSWTHRQGMERNTPGESSLKFSLPA